MCFSLPSWKTVDSESNFGPRAPFLVGRQAAASSWLPARRLCLPFHKKKQITKLLMQHVANYTFPLKQRCGCLRRVSVRHLPLPGLCAVTPTKLCVKRNCCAMQYLRRMTPRAASSSWHTASTTSNCCARITFLWFSNRTQHRPRPLLRRQLQQPPPG